MPTGNCRRSRLGRVRVSPVVVDNFSIVGTGIPLVLALAVVELAHTFQYAQACRWGLGMPSFGGFSDRAKRSWCC